MIEDKENIANISIIKQETTPINNTKNTLGNTTLKKVEAFRLGDNKKNIIKKLVQIQKQQNPNNYNSNEKLEEQRKTSKIILKPIEIRDPRKNCRESSKSREKVVQERPKSKIQIKNKEKKLEEDREKNLMKFAKTTLDFNFKHKMVNKTDIDQDSTNMITNNVTNNNQYTNSNIESSIKMEDMITLSILNSAQALGQCKKMFHSRLFKIYVIKVNRF